MDMTQKAATATARDKRRVQEGGKRVTHKRQCAAAKVMAQATGDSRRQSDDGEATAKANQAKRGASSSSFFFPFLFVFLWKPNLGPRPYTPTHTHTDARTVGQWKQCINMISRTTAEQSRAESRELMPFPGHGLRLELELGHGKVIGRCPDRLLAGHMAPPTPPPPTPPPPPPTAAAAATAPAQHKLLVQPTCMSQIQDTIQEILAYFGSCWASAMWILCSRVGDAAEVQLTRAEAEMEAEAEAEADNADANAPRQ